MILFIFFFVDCCSIFNIDPTLFCYAFYYFFCISMMYRCKYDCFSHIYTLSISSTIELYHHLLSCKSVSLQAINSSSRLRSLHPSGQRILRNLCLLKCLPLLRPALHYGKRSQPWLRLSRAGSLH